MAEQLYLGRGALDPVECASCFEFLHVSYTTRLMCDHSYCWPCLSTFSETSIQSGSYPVCCSEKIPLPLLASFLGPKDLKLADRMTKDHYRDLGYCAVPSCSAVLPPQRIGSRVGRCNECGARTCVKCKRLDHGSKRCSRDIDTARVLKLARRNRWKQCPRCRVLIERSEGCSHMLCTACNQEFCFTCGNSLSKCLCFCRIGCSVM